MYELTLTRRFLHCAQPLRDFLEPSCVILRRVRPVQPRAKRHNSDVSATVNQTLWLIFLAWLLMVWQSASFAGPGACRENGGETRATIASLFHATFVQISLSHLTP